MIPNTENKLDLKRQLINFWQKNKTKILIFGLILIIIISFVIYFNYKNKNKNILIADKYVRAGLYLESNQKNNAKVLYEEIILSKNKFYSILALNTIVEKSLINDDTEILKYFEILESLDFQEEKQDLIIFKKALFYLKISKNNEGRNLLKKLIEKNSKFKSLAEEIKTN
tara:strand:- start:4553 stop:5062 length:510 start_codon:yes stop_codon:yes gene_type:complete